MTMNAGWGKNIKNILKKCKKEKFVASFFYFRWIYPTKKNITEFKLEIDVLENPFLDSSITLDETLMSLKKCKYGKAVGSDQVGYEFLKKTYQAT